MAGMGSLLQLVVAAVLICWLECCSSHVTAPPMQHVPREIVVDMTEDLLQQLAAHGISHLIILGNRDAAMAHTAASATLLNVSHVEESVPVTWMDSYQDHSHIWPMLQQNCRPDGRRSITPGQHKGTGAASQPPSARKHHRRHQQQYSHGSPVQQAHKQAHHTAMHQDGEIHQASGGVAILYPSTDGQVLIGHMHLIGKVRRRLHKCLDMTINLGSRLYWTDFLVYMDKHDAPLRVATRSTNLYMNTFSQIYSVQTWGADGGGSGLGSSLEYTAVLRQNLPRLIKHLGINSMMDSSCGSMHWMPLVLGNVTRQNPGFSFLGLDAACHLIAQHSQTFVHKQSWQFQCLDYAHEKLPSGYDLVFSRDSLQHLPRSAAWQFLNNVKASGAKYLLVGSYVNSTEVNQDTYVGGMYAINLLAPPFNLRPAPLQVIDEETVDQKYMLLFDVSNLEWDDPLWGFV